MPTNKITPEKFDDKKQQREKERIQKEMAADKAKPRCSICGKYTDKKTSPQCFGHGGGGGGGSGGGESGEKASKEDGSTLTKGSVQGDTHKQVQANKVTAKVAFAPPQPRPENRKQDDIKFNANIISEMLSNNLLFINNDKEKGILTIKLLYNPALLPSEYKNELNKYVNSILNELDQFKKEHGISDKCYKLDKDNDGNILSLQISLPIPTLYDAFIQRLANKFLLPMQNVEQQDKEKIVYEKGANHFQPTSLSTKPIPSNKKSIIDEEKKASSIRPKSPRDGLKPTGWK